MNQKRIKIILGVQDFFEKRFAITEGMLYEDMTKFQRVISEIEDFICFKIINKIFSY